MNIGNLTSLFKKHPVGAICGAAAVFLAAILVYRQGAVSGSEMLLNEKIDQGRRLQANIANSAQLDEHLKVLLDANKSIASRLVKGDDRGKNAQYFFQIEADTGVKLVDLRQTTPSVPKGKVGNSTYSRVPYATTVEGTYAQILAFVRRLERGSSFCRIVTASCRQTQAQETGGMDTNAEPRLVLQLNLELLGES